MDDLEPRPEDTFAEKVDKARRKSIRDGKSPTDGGRGSGPGIVTVGGIGCVVLFVVGAVVYAMFFNPNTPRNNPNGAPPPGNANPDGGAPLPEPVNLSGRWDGKLVQNSLEFTLTMTLKQNGNAVTGTARIEWPKTPKTYAVMDLQGNTDGRSFQFQTTQFKENHSTSSVRWVMIKGGLTASKAGDSLALSGTWEPAQAVGVGGKIELKKQ
jgi:hypothetical protein